MNYHNVYNLLPQSYLYASPQQWWSHEASLLPYIDGSRFLSARSASRIL